MNISKALKVKNRLVGELVRLQDIFKRENSKRNDNVSEIDAEKAYNDVLEAFDKVVALKGAINKATAGIAIKLAELSEYKKYLTFIQSVPVKEGPETVQGGYGKDPINYTWKAFINRAKIDEKVAHYQSKIDALQDEIDEFNAKTQVEFDK
jgi:hypothetical protein